MAQDATKDRDLVGSGVYYKVERGMTVKMVPTQRVDWPPSYKDATEKYSSQVVLSTRLECPQVAGRASQISVDPVGQAWVVNGAGFIYRYFY